jgi:hypothetical protein
MESNRGVANGLEGLQTKDKRTRVYGVAKARPLTLTLRKED